MVESPEDLGSGRGTARDSLVVGGCTAVSRATGVVRVVVVGAVLGPTYFGNTFQLTNSLPNLIYYGFLAGSLFSSLLVPALVHHIDRADRARSAGVSGGFLGVAWAVMALVVPVAVLALPPLLQVVGSDQSAVATAQVDHARLLILLTAPQVFLYALAGAATAVMNAHRRFALAAAAPAVENLGVIAVLALVHVLYAGSGTESASQPLGKLLLLGLGSTAAVAAHAALQWWGAHRCGVRLRPRWGWRDPEVVVVVRRAVRSLAQAGLLALQMLTLLLLASRVAGGTVALQMALNFYYLPVALVATPVGLALLPRLSRLHRDEDRGPFGEAFVGGLGLALFLAVPAAVGYLLLAGPVAHVVLAGQMSSEAGFLMLSGSLAALSLGLVGQTCFFVATQAAYARGDTRTPLVSMAIQAAVCLALCAGAALSSSGEVAVVLLGGSYAVASLVGGGHLLRRVLVVHAGGGHGLLRSFGRVLVGALLMTGPVALVVRGLVPADGGRAAWFLALVLGGLVGVAVFFGSQVLLRSPELASLRSAVHRPSTAVVAGRGAES